ncbi:MAG: hypothetical protein INR69_22735 [Mucilaginibacter polytrichastri]|nr:hypothetical protein [Mucilaginibacter polytrichastri]
MKYHTIYLMASVRVLSHHAHISETQHELETAAKLSLSGTPNIEILETEILVTRVKIPNNTKRHGA